MENNLEKKVFEWVTSKPEETQIEDDFYCSTRDIFQARLEKMTRNLLNENIFKEGNIYIASAIAGEIGNNSFDHNLGKWIDVPGIFFAYEILDGKFRVFLADRGQGVLATLKKVKPEITNDSEALKTAFIEKISGRAPENRGNGLKFVKESVKNKKMHLVFISGNAKAELNEKMEIEETGNLVRGCLAILSL